MTGPTAADVRAAFGDEWEIVLTGDGVWHARLTTAARPQPVLTAATLAGLVAEVNDFISGGTR
jgi:hypothetical protein